MTIHGRLFEQFAEQQTREPFSLQNSKMLKVQVGAGPVWAKAGSMVAYQGDIRLSNKGSGGIGKIFKKAVTGEGVSLMLCEGNGDLFLAEDAADVQILYLENDQISVNGRSILAFTHGIDWDIHRVQARGAVMTGDLYNVSLRGSGFVALLTKGEPVALDVGGSPTFADGQAVVMWTAGVRMDVKVDTGGLGSMLRGGTGETFQLAFTGQGYVVVQPYEHRPTPSGGSGGGGGGLLGDLLSD